jgi:hypothetical protein
MNLVVLAGGTRNGLCQTINMAGYSLPNGHLAADGQCPPSPPPGIHKQSAAIKYYTARGCRKWGICRPVLERRVLVCWIESRERVRELGSSAGGRVRPQGVRTMTKAKMEGCQDGLGRSSSPASGLGVGFGSASPLQRWSNVCFLRSSARSSVAKSYGLQLQNGGALAPDQSAVSGI